MLNEFINSYDFVRILESFSYLLFVICFVLLLHLSINLICKLHSYLSKYYNKSNGDNNDLKNL